MIEPLEGQQRYMLQVYTNGAWHDVAFTDRETLEANARHTAQRELAEASEAPADFLRNGGTALEELKRELGLA